MKTLFRAVGILALFLALGVGAAHAQVPASPITVVTTAGGTIVVPQGGNPMHQLCVTNTGATNTMDCSIGAVPSSTNWNFQLAALQSWCAPVGQVLPTSIGNNSAVLPNAAITCIAISSSTTATYLKR